MSTKLIGLLLLLSSAHAATVYLRDPTKSNYCWIKGASGSPVTITCDAEISDADWDLIGSREQNPAGPSAQPAEPAGNTFTVRVLSPDFSPEFTVAAVLYSKSQLGIKAVEVKSIGPK